MKLYKYAKLLLVLPLVAFSIHKYYVSLCEVEFVEEQKSVQITLGVFIDDLELTLNKIHNKQLNLATKQETANIDTYYQEYLTQHLIVTINNTLKEYDYIGKEYDGDVVRFYVEITNIDQLNTIEISNSILFNNFNSQQNIVKIKANNTHKTFYLKLGNDKGLLKF